MYPSPARTDAEKRAKTVILRIKEDRASHLPHLSLIEYAVRGIRRTLDSHTLGSILRPDATLVPMPRSAPLVTNGVWASRAICQALVHPHFGAEWRELVVRVRACKKSALCRPEERPTLTDHFETMRANPTTVRPVAIILVDDIVTKGTTFMAAAAHLGQAYPDVPITAFAMARTSADFTDIRQPCVGEILRLDAKWPWRHDG